MKNRYLDLLQKYRELQKAFDDTLEMNRKFGIENVRLENENEQLKKDLFEIKKKSDFHWEENERLRAELQYIKLRCLS